MRILPVIDLLGGHVVRGVGGRRSEYRPIESQIAADSRPATVAQALSGLGFGAVYIADLDAIAGQPPGWRTYQAIAAAGLDLWIDAGLANLAQARELIAFAANAKCQVSIIAGLESLASPELLGQFVELIGHSRLVFSLDLKQGQTITAVPAWRAAAPFDLAETAIALGVRRMIVLDLAGVGSGAGVPTESLCRELRATYPQLELTSGGGVRSALDLQSLRDCGCDFALVASALHDGRLAPKQIAELI